MAEEDEVEASGRPRVRLQVEALLRQVSDVLGRAGERAERRGDVTVI